MILRSSEDCQKARFHSRRGFDNCIAHCVFGFNPDNLEWIEEQVQVLHPSFIGQRRISPPVGKLSPSFTPGYCRSSNDCDHGRNMCNFDNENEGSCEN